MRSMLVYFNIFAVASFLFAYRIYNSIENKNKPILLELNDNFERLNDEYLSSKHSQISMSNTSLQKSSDVLNETLTYRNSEWEQLNKYTFFRRSTANYFIDAELLRIYFITHSEIKHYNYSVELFVYEYPDKLLYKIYISNCTTKIHDRQHKYILKYLDIKSLNLAYYDSFRTYMKLFIIDETSVSLKLRTRDPIDVKYKYAYNQNRSGSIICSTCFYYFRDNMNHSDPYFFKTFRWWFELNKRFGYKKVVIFNTSIPNTKDYNDLFEEYKDFVQVNNLKYLPNFFYPKGLEYKHDEHDYMTSFQNMSIPQYALFQMLVINECYLNNKHLYEYISVLDQDETIIPKVNNQLTRNIDNYNLIKSLDIESIVNKYELNKKLNLESSCSISNNKIDDIDIYLKDLRKNSKNDETFTFPMSYYLSYESIELIFNEFESYFKANNYTIGNNKIIIIKLNDENYKNYTYNFMFRNQDDINYIKNMIKIYKLLVKDFFISNRNKLNEYSNEYNRYIYLGGAITSHRCGKTIHNTNITWQMNPHYQVGSHARFISYDSGVSSHFRVGYNFRVNATIPVGEMILDLNYIYCYYRFVLKHFTSLDVIND